MNKNCCSQKFIEINETETYLIGRNHEITCHLMNLIINGIIF